MMKAGSKLWTQRKINHKTHKIPLLMPTKSHNFILMIMYYDRFRSKLFISKRLEEIERAKQGTNKRREKQIRKPEA